MALALDATTPAKVTGNGTVTTASFTPPAGAVLLACGVSNAPDSGAFNLTVSGGSLTWTLRQRRNTGTGSGQEGTAEVWTAVADGAALTVAASGPSTGSGREKMLKVVVLTGADTAALTNTTAASSNSGTVTVALAGCLAGSHVFAASSDWTQSGLGTFGAGQTVIDEDNPAGQYTGHVWRTTNVLGGAGSQTMNMTAPTGQDFNLVVIEIREAAVAAVPYAARQASPPRDYSGVPWTQRDRRDALLVGEAVNPLVPPLDSAWQAGGRHWHLYGDAAARPAGRPSQRAYVSDPALLPAAPDIPAGPSRQPQPRPPAAQWQARPRDPSLLAAALLEGELLGGAETGKRVQTPATHADRRLVPQQRDRESDPGLLATAELENELLGWATTTGRSLTPATHGDRRQPGQQRTALVDASAPPGFDPTLPGPATARMAAAYTDRRETPAQRTHPAPLDPPAADVPYAAPRAAPARDTRAWPQPRPALTDLIATAADPFDPTLTGPAPAARTAATHADRRQAGQQRTAVAAPDDVILVGTGALVAWWGADDLTGYTQTRRYDAAGLPAPVAADPLLSAWLPGWLAGNVAATHASRRLAPRQRTAAVDQSSPPDVYDPTLAGWGPGLLADLTPATHAGRRLVPTQRTYPAPPDPVVTVGTGALAAWWSDDPQGAYMAATMPRAGDPTLLDPPATPFDPTLAGWLVTRLTRDVPATHADRRPVPTQRTHPDLSLLAAALLEGPLLGGSDDLARHRAWHTDHREVPTQRAAAAALLADEFDPSLTAAPLVRFAAVYADRGGRPRPVAPPGLPLPPAVLFDPTVSAWATGLLVRHLAATHADRRLVPAQPDRLDLAPFAFQPGIVGAVTTHTASITGAVTTVTLGIIGEIT